MHAQLSADRAISLSRSASDGHGRPLALDRKPQPVERRSAPPPDRHGSRVDWPRPLCRRRGSPPRTRSAGIGSAPVPATTPSITALIMAPLSRAIASRSSSSEFREFFSYRFDQPLLIVAAVAHRHLLNHQIGAAGRRDRRGAIWRHVAARDGAASLHQFACNDQIDIADARRERQDRASTVRRTALRQQLDVVGRGAGALRNAGDRGRLYREVLAAAAATIQSVSTPPPSPPSAAIKMVIGRAACMACCRMGTGTGCDRTWV